MQNTDPAPWAIPDIFQRILMNRIPSDFMGRIDAISSNQGDQETDPFGMDLGEFKKTALLAAFLYKYYFRCETTGIENIPNGPVILIANHGGQIPINAVMIISSLILESEQPRLCRSLTSEQISSLPFLSTWFSRIGAALGTPANAQLLLQNDGALLMFPEGMAGMTKNLDDAYELKEFDPSFVHLALTCKAPIVPVSVVGAEEQYPTLFQIKTGSRLLGVPSIPIWAQGIIPLLGLLPIPVKYHLEFGTPFYFQGDPDEDSGVIDEMVQQVKEHIRSTTNRIRESRRSVFY